MDVAQLVAPFKGRPWSWPSLEKCWTPERCLLFLFHHLCICFSSQAAAGSGYHVCSLNVTAVDTTVV